MCWLWCYCHGSCVHGSRNWDAWPDEKSVQYCSWSIWELELESGDVFREGTDYREMGTFQPGNPVHGTTGSAHQGLRAGSLGVQHWGIQSGCPIWLPGCTASLPVLLSPRGLHTPLSRGCGADLSMRFCVHVNYAGRLTSTGSGPYDQKSRLLWSEMKLAAPTLQETLPGL